MPLTILMVALTFILGFALSGRSCGSKVGVGIVSHNFSNAWTYKFDYLDGKVLGMFTARNVNSRLVYGGNIIKGDIEFRLYDRTDNLLAVFDGKTVRDTVIYGPFNKGEKYRILAIIEKANGDFYFKME